MRLNLEVLKVVVALSSPFRLSVHPSLSTASVRLARQKNLAEHQYQGRAKREISVLSTAVVFSQTQRMTGAKLKSTYSR